MSVFNVSNSSELLAALSAATGGDEIRLAGGNYGDLSLNPNSGVNFSSPVKIISNDPNSPASFSGMDLDGVSNLTFDSVVFDYQFAGESKPTYKPFFIENSSNITIQNSDFVGDIASGLSSVHDGYGFGVGLRVEGTSGFTLDNNEFSDWYHGAQFYEVQNLDVTNNEVHSLRSDGMNFIEVQSVLIQDNYFHDFKASPTSGDHQDMIQFWKNNTDQPSTDVIIRDNILDIGNGSRTQSIYFGNSGISDRNLDFQNILIEGNEIYSAHHHGITVGQANGVVIQDNTIVQVTPNPNDPHNQVTGGVLIPKINVDSNSLNVTIDDNIMPRITGYSGQSSWTVTSNVTLQSTDPNAEGYLPDLLIARDASIAAWNDGSATDTSSGTSTDTSSGTSTDTSGGTSTDTSGGTSTDTSGGTSTDTSGGTGGTSTTTGTVADVSDLEIDDYVLDFTQLAGSSALKGDSTVVTTANGDVLQLDGDKDYVDLGRLQQFEQSDQLSFSVDFSRDVADGGDARLVWNHQKIALGIEDDGFYIKVAVEGQRWQTIRVDNLGLNDTELHTATVIIDDATDRLQVIVDDQIVLDDTSFDFEINSGKERGWTLGTKWNAWLDGDISDFAIEADAQFVDTTSVVDVLG